MLNEFVDEINKTIEKKLNDIHTIIPGKILEYDVKTGLATVLPTMKYKTDKGELLDYPQISGVPVIFYQFSNQNVSIVGPIQEGDGCLILVAEQSIDYWMYESDNNMDLKFDLSNAICLPGLFSKPNEDVKNAIENNSFIIKSGNSQITFKDGKIYIDSSETVYSGAFSIDGDFEISGKLTAGEVSAGSIQSEGNISAGSLNISGQINSGNIHSNGTISGNSVSATGSISANSLNVGGNAQVTGNLTVGGLIYGTLYQGGGGGGGDDPDTPGGDTDDVVATGTATSSDTLNQKYVYFQYTKYRSGKIMISGEESTDYGIPYSQVKYGDIFYLSVPKDDITHEELFSSAPKSYSCSDSYGTVNAVHNGYIKDVSFIMEGKRNALRFEITETKLGSIHLSFTIEV